jgi:hypothetical protein
VRLAGLVATELGRIPAVGDTVAVDGWLLDVVDASGRRAARVMLHAPLGGPGDDGDGHGDDGRRHDDRHRDRGRHGGGDHLRDRRGDGDGDGNGDGHVTGAGRRGARKDGEAGR